jgi:thioredoxin-like negative regulator of GroEL
MYAKMVLSAVLLGAAALAHALEVKPYSAQALAAAQKADQPVAIQFHADWCPTCKAQDKVLQSLKAEPGLDVTLLIANYDTEKALKKRFNVRAQSTIVALHGKQERARLVGETSEDSIRKVLKAAL